MNNRFDDALNECIRHLESSGGDIEAVLSRYPERTDELRAHLRIWASLSSAERVDASPLGVTRGRSLLLNAVATVERGERGTLMQSLANSAGLTLKLIGGFAVVATVAMAMAYFTGNLRVGVGDEAQATHSGPFACLDSIPLADLAAPAHDFGAEDLLAFRDAYENQNPVGPGSIYDRDADGDVDLDDISAFVEEAKLACNFP
jgi:hypothetical protein